MGRRSGFTLLELAIVLVILIALAGIVTPMVVGVQENAGQTVTQTTLLSLRDAIMGKPGGPTGFLSDVGQMPNSLNDLYICPTSLPSQLQQYDPQTHRGWNGPYLLGSAPPKDAWNNAIVINIDPTTGVASLVSPGPPNQSGGGLVLNLNPNNGQP